jgi:hypothetical protein
MERRTKPPKRVLVSGTASKPTKCLHFVPCMCGFCAPLSRPYLFEVPGPFGVLAGPIWKAAGPVGNLYGTLAVIVGYWSQNCLLPQAPP